MSGEGAPSRPRATVVVPTFGDAPFVACAIASAQAQTVRELEIHVLLDDSPPHVVRIVEDIAGQDGRVQVHAFPKAPRTGEIHRAQGLAGTAGEIVCYLSHDDLWFPGHVGTMERLLADADFGHSLHVDVGLGCEAGRVQWLGLADIAHPEYRRLMLDLEPPCNFFGLTCGAHTRAAYERLPEGWATAPDGVPTDLQMWRKFLAQPGIRAASHLGVTALHFPAATWTRLFGPREMEAELRRYLARLPDPAFHEEIVSLALRRAAHAALDLRLTARRALREELALLPRAPGPEELRRLVGEEVTRALESRVPAPGLGDLRGAIREEIWDGMRRWPVNDMATRLWLRLRKRMGGREADT